MSLAPDAELVMAAALHDTDEVCNAHHYLPFEECATREWDISRAAEVIEALRSRGWRLVADDGQSMNWLHEALNSGDGTYRP